MVTRVKVALIVAVLRWCWQKVVEWKDKMRDWWVEVSGSINKIVVWMGEDSEMI